MEKDHSADLINVDLELLSVLLQNPYLTRPGDEIGETALIKWVERECKSHAGTVVKKEDILGLITKLILEGVFTGKRYGKKMLLKPTHNYYLLKSGQPMVPLKREKTQVSLFADSDDHSFIEKNRLLEASEIGDTPLHADEGFGERKLSQGATAPYSRSLLEIIRHYDGPDKGLVKYLPAFFNLACNILNDRYTDWHTKILISSALGYFVLEEDVIPNHTEFGYLDDLYLLVYALRETKRHVSPSLLEDNWGYSENIHDLIEEVYHDTYTVIQDYACEILHKVGLRKFKELELEEYSGTYPQKIAKLAQEKRELIALTAYLIKLIYRTNLKGRELKRIKDFLMQYGDYTEIARLIELSNRDYSTETALEPDMESFEVDLERELQQARLNALLDDQDTE